MFHESFHNHIPFDDVSSLFLYYESLYVEHIRINSKNPPIPFQYSADVVVMVRGRVVMADGRVRVDRVCDVKFRFYFTFNFTVNLP